MSKYRFTDRDKWSDKWYRSLSIEEKVMFEYIRDNCDNAGFYEIDIEIIIIHTKLTEPQILGALLGLIRCYIEVDGVLWLKNFLRHQKNLPLNPKNNAHKEIINIIQLKLNLFPDIPKIIGADKGLFRGPGKGHGNSNGKGNSKGKKNIVTFIVPSREEIKKYIKNNGYDIDPDKWYDFYQAKNWMIGKNKMKDWKAAVRTWIPDKRKNSDIQWPGEENE